MNILAKNEYQIFLSLVIQYVKYSFTPNLILGTKKLVAWIVDLVAKRVDRALNTISLPTDYNRQHLLCLQDSNKISKDIRIKLP